MPVYETAQIILDEINQVIQRVDQAQIDRLTASIRGAGRIVTHSLGREGLVLRGFAMRLMHLGFQVAVVGDMTTPPVGDGDLFLISCGPGYIKSTATLVDIAHAAGGKVALLTAEPESMLSKLADQVIYIPAQTMARAENQGSAQLMGSIYEQAMWILLDAVVIQLKEETGETPDQIRARHTNME